MNAVSVSVFIVSCFALINLGSTVVFNAITSLYSVSILCSYFIVISCVIMRRVSGPPLPPRRWSLGKYGLVINIIALLFITPLWFFAFWPLAQPVTPTNLDWAPVLFAGTIAFALFYYFTWARRLYTGPVVLVKRE